jgi:hypothetical protein
MSPPVEGQLGAMITTPSNGWGSDYHRPSEPLGAIITTRGGGKCHHP